MCNTRPGPVLESKGAPLIASACDKKPHIGASARIAGEARTMQAATVTMIERCGRAAALIAVCFSALAACGTTTDSPNDVDASPSDAPAADDTTLRDASSGDSPTVDATMLADQDAMMTDVGDDDAAPCTPDPDASVECPTDLPPDDDCPNAAPSYANKVAPVIAARCTVCHRPGGPGAAFQFDTYAKIAANGNKLHMTTQIYQCRMPPPSCAEPLGAEERQTILQWLVCGGPNN